MKSKSVIFMTVLVVLALCGSVVFGQEVQIVYDSTDTPKPLLEWGTTASTLVIADSGFITRTTVRLNITHESADELEAYLIGPDGTRVKLFANIGAGGSDLSDTWLFDNSELSITEGEAPFTGGHRPEGGLSDFDFKNIEGTWTLEIKDSRQGISGTLNSWALVFRAITSNLYFEDTFSATKIDEWNWIDVDGATVDSVGMNSPSGPYSLRLNGNPSGGDSITSRAINLSGCLNAILIYSYERTALGYSGGESPDKGEDLIFECRPAGSDWIVVDRQPGDGPDMTSFQQVSVLLPPEALRRNCYFRIRRAAGTVGPYDDWFVDNVKIQLNNLESPGIVSNPSIEGQTWGWTTTQTFSSSQWQSDGSYSARVFTIPQITHEAGTWVGLSQSIDMSNIVAIKFDASTVAGSGGTWENCVASVYIDDTEVWSDTGADKTWLDVQVDTAEYTGVHTLSLRLSFLETGTFDEDVHFDNVRTYLAE
jgi:subtilisin-like proprotein convertase family protein